MQAIRVKYFSKVDHAEQLLEGRVLCRTLAFFRDYEDKIAEQAIGDEYEGTRIYRPLDGLEIIKHNVSGKLDMGMECLTKADEIYVYCISLSLTDELKREFNAEAYVEILDPAEFIQRWKSALPDTSKSVARRVEYYLPQDVPGNVWALPDLIATTKLKRFSYQQEYRFAYTTTDAFGFENCKYQLVDRKNRPVPKPEEHHDQMLELGSLHDICELHLTNV